MSKLHLKPVLEDIKWLYEIAGRSMGNCKNAIEETENTVEAIDYLLKLGVPCIGFADDEDKEQFLSNYPNKNEIIKRLLLKIS